MSRTGPLVFALLLLAAPAARADVWMYTDPQGGLHLTDTPTHRGYVRVSAPRRSRVRVTRAWDGVIRLSAERRGLEPALVKAMIHVESGFDPEAVSRKGARGLMQLMPRTALLMGVDDPFNPWQNIDGGVRYLEYLMRRFSDDKRLALAAYNAGESAVRRHRGIPPYRETRNYVTQVLALSRRYDADFR